MKSKVELRNEFRASLEDAAPVNEVAEIVPDDKMNSIDLRSLEKRLSKAIGGKINLIMKRGRQGGVEITSGNIQNQTGIIAPYTKSVIWRTFSDGRMSPKENKMWMTTGLKFTWDSGGENWTGTSPIWYDFDTKEWDLSRVFSR